jgi:hypothetical protein
MMSRAWDETGSPLFSADAQNPPITRTAAIFLHLAYNNFSPNSHFFQQGNLSPSH